MAAFAVIGAVGEIDSQRYFVRYFLKYNIVISVPKHNI